MRVALDAMTSELGVEEAIHGLFDALAAQSDLEILAVGDPNVLEPLLAKGPSALRSRAHLAPATEVIGMDEEPGQAFKTKKDASVSVACRLVKEGKAEAALSPGNTGASMAAATLTLGRLEGVRRPAILTFLPNGKGRTALMDSGAVTDCRPEDLVQWAIMGQLYLQHARGVAQPRVGLLSIGEEDKKGNAQTLETLPLLRQAPLHFIGNVEGRDIFDGSCDLVVCDGFVGNVVLKTAEGLAKMIMSELRAEYEKAGKLGQLGGYLSKPVFANLRRTLSPDEAGGGALLGVAGNFIITHGHSNRVMLRNAIRVATDCIKHDVTAKMANAFRPAA
jgi:glycerol-3-phosphate acyltransferase PlsX